MPVHHLLEQILNEYIEAADLLASRKGMDEGADDFLMKPVSLRAFLSCVKARFNRASLIWPVEDLMAA
jgi:DNA-binding response OmpR family regulator